jgi:dipeptidyl aminopeptidase/acylaminoacyl peptidase
LLTIVRGLNSGPTDWSPDGRFLLYEQSGEKTGFDLWLLPLFGDRKPMPYLQTQFDEGQGRFSPDGHWVAYASTETGRPEVYVQTFPASGGKWQISNGGGMLPLWRRDGKELFYVVPAVGRLMSVEVKTSPQFEPSAPKFLFQAPFALTHQMDAGNHYAVSADGQRFLLNLPIQENASSPITVVLNWTAGLKK